YGSAAERLLDSQRGFHDGLGVAAAGAPGRALDRAGDEGWAVAGRAGWSQAPAPDDLSPAPPFLSGFGAMLDRWYERVGRRRLLAGLGVAAAVAIVAAVPGVVLGGGSAGPTRVRTATGLAAGEQSVQAPPSPGTVTAI